MKTSLWLGASVPRISWAFLLHVIWKRGLRLAFVWAEGLSPLSVGITRCVISDLASNGGSGAEKHSRPTLHLPLEISSLAFVYESTGCLLIAG